MFEQELQEMTATIYIETGMYQTLTASNVGVSGVYSGGHTYHFEDALSVIRNINCALIPCPKYLKKGINAQRISFILAFGPEMECLCK